MKVILIMLALIGSVYSANILYISSVPSPSHFIWCRSLLKSLEKRGHNITALSPDVEESSASLTYFHLERMYPYIYKKMGAEAEVDFFELGDMTINQQFNLYLQMSSEACVEILNSNGYKQLLSYPNDFKFDLVIYDNTAGPCLLPFVAKFGFPPILSVTPFPGLSRMSYHTGLPLFSAFSSSGYLPYTSSMNFKERFISFYTGILEYRFSYNVISVIDEIVRKHLPKDFPQVPFLGDIERSAKIFLINSNHLFGQREPAYEHIKFVGGAQVNDPKLLPADLQEICDGAKEGFILFSMGSNVRSESLGSERIVKILNALKQFPQYSFLWKFEIAEKLPIDLPKNVYIRSWLPQTDLLAHPNIKLFMTHAGALSTQEAMWYGVPLLGIPVFVDQFKNIAQMVEIGVAKRFDVRSFDSQELVKAIKEVLDNPSYGQKAKEISNAFRDQPQTPLETATFWAEWVMRNPNINSQNTAALNLNFLGLHSYDVILLTIFGIFAVFIVLIKVFKKLITCIVKFKPKDKKKVQ